MKRKADGGEERMDEEERGGLSEEHGDIRGDEKNVAFLLFLYLLQGVPLGLCAAIPMILQNRGVSYRQQAEFSFVQWPFSLKLLWAPLVDAIFVPRFGRRKTWLVPTQYLMGLFMLYLSGHVEHWLNDDREGHGVGPLTLLFFTLNVLAATQDIVVDGWALTMLKRKNVGYASTCNSVGQTAGYFLGYVLFMALESAEFCNGYLRSVPSDVGIVTLPGFLYAWGWIFVTATTLIALMKHEEAETNRRSDDIIGHAKQAYDSLWSIVKLPTVAMTATILLTAKIGFSACDAVTGLKLVEAGVPKEKLALMAVPLVPLQIVLPLAVSRYTAGDRPLDIYLRAVPYRLVLGLLAALLVWVTPSMIYHDGGLPAHYAVILITLYVFHQIAASSMFVASMAFFAKVSDPALGGTYMTFLNTLCNLGGNWPATAALWFVDALTLRRCSTDSSNDCGDTVARETCASRDNGECEIRLDGYYTESLLCIVVGFLWLAWARKKIDYLQSRPRSAWRVVEPREGQRNVKIR